MCTIGETEAGKAGGQTMRRAGLTLLAAVPLQYLTTLCVLWAFRPALGPAGALRVLRGGGAGAGAPALAVSMLLSSLAGLGLPALLCARAQGLDIKRMFAAPKADAGETAAFGIVAVGVSLLASSALGAAQLLLKTALRVQLTAPDFRLPWNSPFAAAVYIAAILAAAPLAEEFLFRGVLLRLLRRFGDGFAVAASALCWALLHGNFVQGVPIFAIGLFLGLLALRADSIVPTVLIHMGNNLLALAETEAARRAAAVPGVGLFNAAWVLAGMLLLVRGAPVFFPPGAGKAPLSRGFRPFFACVPVLLFLLLCAGRFALSVKPA